MLIEIFSETLVLWDNFTVEVRVLLRKYQLEDKIISANRIFNDAIVGADVRPLVAKARLEEGLPLGPVEEYTKIKWGIGGVEMVKDKLYQEVYRPQFHFTAKKNWLNDPNGLVYYKGEYHLFFQHNPLGTDLGNMTWGHAVSSDMVRWKQLPNAIEPDELGMIFSGSGVVDWNNTAGFQSGKEVAMVNIYTSTGKPFTQSIAYSNDRGRTWIKYEKNPVLGHIVGGNRDPKVIWHAPTKRWVMALYLDANDYQLFTSPNLKQWTWLCDIQLPRAGECPDIFELPVDGDKENTKWVFWGANGSYIIGTFNGYSFRRESEVLQSDWGANFYAAQTWNDIPDSDGRRLQIAWMSGGKYPDMPFNQQMSFPCQLTLFTTPEGIRLYRRPIKEIENIHQKEYSWNNQILEPDDDPFWDIQGELFHIQAEVEVESAAEFGFILRGESIRYTAPTASFSAWGNLHPSSHFGARSSWKSCSTGPRWKSSVMTAESP